MKQLIKETLDELQEVTKLRDAGIWQGTDKFKDQKMKILYKKVLTFQCPLTELSIATESGCDKEWAREHFDERVGGKPTNPGESYKRWPYANFKEGDDFLKHDEKFSHTYQERFWPTDGIYPFKGIRYNYGDLNDVVNQLKDNQLTRQAYLPIFFPEDTGSTEGQRVPCTLGYHFEIIDNKITVNYFIRSCDAYRHLRNDIYFTSRLLNHIYLELRTAGIQIGLGTVTMFISNLHLFVNDEYPLKKRERGLQKL